MSLFYQCFSQLWGNVLIKHRRDARSLVLHGQDVLAQDVLGPQCLSLLECGHCLWTGFQRPCHVCRFRGLWKRSWLACLFALRHFYITKDLYKDAFISLPRSRLRFINSDTRYAEDMSPILNSCLSSGGASGASGVGRGFLALGLGVGGGACGGSGACGALRGLPGFRFGVGGSGVGGGAGGGASGVGGWGSSGISISPTGISSTILIN